MLIGRRFSPLFILIFCLFYGCKKDSDENPPIIIWELPMASKSFSVHDEIFVKANINDDKRIKSVHLSLFSVTTGQLVQSPIIIAPDQKNFTLSLNVGIKDTLLNSGEYYFRIEANDGDNTQIEFRFISIEGIPKERLGLIVVCEKPNGNEFYIDNGDFLFSTFHTSSASYLGSVINNIDQHYWVASNKSASIKAFQLKSTNLDFEEKPISNFADLFTSIDFHDRTVFLADRRGMINGYDEAFVKSLSYSLEGENRRVLSIKSNEEYILALEEDITGANKGIQIILRSSGFLKGSIFMTRGVEAIYFSEKEKAVVFQNDENGGLISELDLVNETRRTLSSVPDSILSVEQIHDIEYLISTKTKILRYELSKNNFFDYLDIENAVMAFDTLNNSIFIASGSSLMAFDYHSRSEINQSSFGFPIKGVNIRYNR